MSSVKNYHPFQSISLGLTNRHSALLEKQPKLIPLSSSLLLIKSSVPIPILPSSRFDSTLRMTLNFNYRNLEHKMMLCMISYTVPTIKGIAVANGNQETDWGDAVKLAATTYYHSLGIVFPDNTMLNRLKGQIQNICNEHNEKWNWYEGLV
jgi:hypothetical protein